MPEHIEKETLYIKLEPPVATLTFNRPDIRNAFNAQMIRDLTWAIPEIEKMDDIRVVVLTGEGTAFSAGADLNYMKSMKDFTIDENVADAEAISRSFNLIYKCRKPTIAKVNGAAIGGGCGLVAACDIAIAADEAVFSLSEVKIGVVPACAGPFVVKRIGEANARYLMLSGQRFDGKEAAKYGLVNWSVPLDQLDAEVFKTVKLLVSSGPEAMWVAKELARLVPSMTEEETLTIPARMLAELRVSTEGQEGIEAFLEKRKPKWSIKLEEEK